MAPVRLCIIGNSHLAALRTAWDAVGIAHPEVKATFFALGFDRWDGVVMDSERIVARGEAARRAFALSSGGHTEIVFRDYDWFLVHGMFVLRDMLQAARWRQRVQRGTPVAAPVDFLDGTHAGRMRAVLAACGKPWLMSPAPRVSEAALAHPDTKTFGPWKQMLDTQGQPWPAIRDIIRQWDAFTAGPGMLPQPAVTKDATGLFSLRQYRTELNLRPRSSIEFPGSEDCTHMNGRYGELVLESALARFAQALQPAAIDGGRHMEGEAASAGQRAHPYSGLPASAHWKRAVAGRDGVDVTDWYRRKFDLADARIAAAGSCFAQHLGRRLRQSGFHYVDAEPAPADLPAGRHLAEGYSMYSARYGNLYTTRQLVQLFDRAFGDFTPQEEAWEHGGGLVDPFRPTIRSTPFADIHELRASRDEHLDAVRKLFRGTDVFVFTLGLTETWADREDGAVFPVAPGVSGGSYDPQRHMLLNLTAGDVLDDMRRFIAKTRAINPAMRYLLTVSPVPLMATASGQHVVAATTYSKSVLRAVAGQLAQELDYVDYFPSFEIINSHVMGGRFYEADKRSVSEQGVDHVMRQFFAEHQPPGAGAQEEAGADASVQCDEELLAAFGKGGAGN